MVPTAPVSSMRMVRAIRVGVRPRNGTVGGEVMHDPPMRAGLVRLFLSSLVRELLVPVSLSYVSGVLIVDVNGGGDTAEVLVHIMRGERATMPGSRVVKAIPFGSAVRVSVRVTVMRLMRNGGRKIGGLIVSRLGGDVRVTVSVAVNVLEVVLMRDG